ncbi:MAG: hypothetical protein WBP08_00830 [Saprospiraceae bacterium]
MSRLILIVFIFSTTIIFSQDSFFADGNRAFSEGKYEQAIENYKKVEQRDLGGFGLYSNMARSYAMLRQDAMSILFFEKALKLRPNDIATKKDLMHIRKRNPDLDIGLEKFWASKIWAYITGIFSSDLWAIFSLFLLSILCIYIVLNKKLILYNKKHSAITSIIMLFFVFSMMAARSREKDIYHNQGMIIMSESVQLKAGPDESSPVISDLAPGSKVYKNDFIGEWTQVRNEYGDLGWIRTTSAGKI